MLHNQDDIEIIRAYWVEIYGGEYSDEFIDAYMGFVEKLSAISIDAERLLMTLDATPLPDYAEKQIKNYFEMHAQGSVYSGVKEEIESLLKGIIKS